MKNFFRIHEPGEEDFVFLDPPYDSEFSTYAGNEFDRRDQERLADFLLNRCRARFMLVIKNHAELLSGLFILRERKQREAGNCMWECLTKSM